ncbi:hypothetical protein [Bradyrhizobium sp. 6(2017)]|uniref:hypothetical protein n=1 Tax=Bradyrhizobium sp. 6(2017) TaxID=1197460 RepID=UPI0013E1D097|nr:hypothetical protein [Bradyrhizobium sp. 6(2017)]QIG91974.1 hypothetical protein G6P99_05295 [Bradyrhizobium sp. 6(2017)]
MTSQVNARHAEIRRRYAWHAQQRREKPDQARLITLIRLRELERIFQSRYGRFLPDDDAGMDDLTVAAHHVAFLRGDVATHIVAWARSWAPWLPQDKAKQLAERVAAEPRKFTADALAWRLRLSMAERTALKITTIGAFDVSKAEREEERKRKRREAERARRAKARSGAARGRPRKMRGQQVEDILLATDFPPASDTAREVSEGTAVVEHPIRENKSNSLPAARASLVDLEEAQPAMPPSVATRAASPDIVPPPFDAINQAVELVRKHPSMRLPKDRQAVQRMFERFWRRYAPAIVEIAARIYGHFDPGRDTRWWTTVFGVFLDREAEAIERYRERRRGWERKREDRVTVERFVSPVRELTRDEIWAREDRREAQRRRRAELLSRCTGLRAAS